MIKGTRLFFEKNPHPNPLHACGERVRVRGFLFKKWKICYKKVTCYLFLLRAYKPKIYKNTRKAYGL